jgi:ribonucleoside-triphosphate reductase (thioredoxin)
MTQLPSDYQTFIHQSKYARWTEEDKRRETWTETVQRYFDFLSNHLSVNHSFTIPNSLLTELTSAVTDLEIMPSMRALMTAGPALERDNVCGYNCAYLPVDSLRSFDETLYILMCGTGVGFSVERQCINKLPIINEHFEKSDTVIAVADSKAGWARGLRELLSLLWHGQIPKWDLTKLRPAGAKLKTFGGRSSGPEPLNSLFNYVVAIISGAAGRKLHSLECHDIMCKIGEVVVVGGVRRSAMISLSNFSDGRLREAKTGQWWDANSQRSLSNNSIAYTEKPEMGAFMREWSSLHDSGSGERGIFNRTAAKSQAGRNGRRDTEHEFGTNPCSEIILRPYQFCNLTETVVRSYDTFESLKRKVRLASILGTFQSTLTSFKYLRKIWTDNTEDERLLGVSLTGIMDNKLMSGEEEKGEEGYFLDEHLDRLKQEVIDVNTKYAKKLGIPQSTATTCVKPSGTVSQLVDSSSGIHPRFSPQYIRTVRGDKKDPLTQFLTDQGVPVEDDLMNPGSTSVFSFPIQAPEGCITVADVTAMQQLELWLTYQRHWCEHKPSITVYVKENEWMQVGAWVYEHFDEVSGISFLPYTGHNYQQAPYQPLELKTWKILAKEHGVINWDKLRDYETEDTTKGSQTMACTGGVCEVVDI